MNTYKPIILITILACSIITLGQPKKIQTKSSNTKPQSTDFQFMPGVKGRRVFCVVTVKGKLEQKELNGGYHRHVIDPTYKLDAVLDMGAPIVEQAKSGSKNQYAIPKMSGAVWSVNTVKKQ